MVEDATRFSSLSMKRDEHRFQASPKTPLQSLAGASACGCLFSHSHSWTRITAGLGLRHCSITWIPSYITGPQTGQDLIQLLIFSRLPWESAPASRSHG